jgi:hypothetical protein
MNNVKFIEALRQRAIENDNQFYQNLLDSTDEAKDPVWNKILYIYRNCSTEQKKSIVDFIRLIQVNTMSHILGVLDGSTYLSEDRELFILKAEKSDEMINGDLQDIFLGMEEM